MLLWSKLQFTCLVQFSQFGIFLLRESSGLLSAFFGFFVPKTRLRFLPLWASEVSREFDALMLVGFAPFWPHSSGRKRDWRQDDVLPRLNIYHHNAIQLIKMKSYLKCFRQIARCRRLFRPRNIPMWYYSYLLERHSRDNSVRRSKAAEANISAMYWKGMTCCRQMNLQKVKRSMRRLSICITWEIQ